MLLQFNSFSKEVPEAWGQDGSFAALQTLDLSANYLTGEGLKINMKAYWLAGGVEGTFHFIPVGIMGIKIDCSARGTSAQVIWKSGKPPSLPTSYI